MASAWNRPIFGASNGLHSAAWELTEIPRQGGFETVEAGLVAYPHRYHHIGFHIVIRNIVESWLLVAALLAFVVADRCVGQDRNSPLPTIGPSVGTATLAPDAVEQPYFDLDAYLDQRRYPAPHSDGWYWQWMPNDLIYKSYLAGVKEPRLAGKVVYGRHDGWLWDNTLGGRVGLLRFGDTDPQFPQGFQIDAEGAAEVRLDITREVDVRSVDFRGGIPITYGFGRQQVKLAYYHMSAHLGDEFLLKNSGYPRLNWSRDAFVLGYSVYPNDSLRLYAEMAWAFQSEISEPWEFQFGLDWAPTQPTGCHGAPFFAINAHLREELDFGGNLNVETGWAWISDRDRHMLRIGMQYYTGKSPQNSFYDNSETLLGFGVWYDF